MPSTPPMAVATAIITLSIILQVDFPFCFSMGVMFLKVIHFFCVFGRTHGSAPTS